MDFKIDINAVKDILKDLLDKLCEYIITLFKEKTGYEEAEG